MNAQGTPWGGSPLTAHTSRTITCHYSWPLNNPGQEHQPPHRWKSHVLLWTTVGPSLPQIQLTAGWNQYSCLQLGICGWGCENTVFHLLLVESAHVKPMGRKGQLWIEKDAPARGPAQFQSVLFAGQLCLLCSKLHRPLLATEEFPRVQVSAACGRNSCRSRSLWPYAGKALSGRWAGQPQEFGAAPLNSWPIAFPSLLLSQALGLCSLWPHSTLVSHHFYFSMNELSLCYLLPTQSSFLAFTVTIESNYIIIPPWVNVMQLQESECHE